jgi:hypothetical protein
LKNRVRTASGALLPWRSPKGTPLSIAAAYPRWEWSDLASALLPNGRFLDFSAATNGLSRNPIGVPIQSYLNGLFALGLAIGYYCGEPPASPCPDASANLPFDFPQTLRRAVRQQDRRDRRHLYTNHSAFSLPLPTGGPAPLLLQNGWTTTCSRPQRGYACTTS